jgi:hypothetical protein
VSAMHQIKYHPLIGDAEDADKIPMFSTPSEAAVKGKHSLYLEEILPNCYRLHAKAAHSRDDYKEYRIHCPSCGAVMSIIASHIDNYTLALYSCFECS